MSCLLYTSVKGRNLGAKIKNDTIEFSPDVFKNGSEQNMSDVIKKLPGMTVDESAMCIRDRAKKHVANLAH